MSLLDSSGLSDILEGMGYFSVLAPSNAAFDRLPPAFAQMLSLNEADLRKVTSATPKPKHSNYKLYL